ncbi:MAG: DNA translocase FtsK [Parcubacteria group bacterium]|nr:DNA translocase FtsK [Parcubacteria group bacterium]
MRGDNFPDTNPELEYNDAENTGFRLMGLRKKIKSQASEEKSSAPLTLSKSSLRKKIDIPLNLLSNNVTKPRAGDTVLNGEKIKKTFENFGISVEMGPVTIGPTITQYTLKPAEGVKLSRIEGLSSNLALSLAAKSIRIEAPIPGKSLVGIEVPNSSVATVRLREILESQEFKQEKSKLTIAIGKDVAGKVWTANLAKMPHLLVAGASGSGKTINIISIVMSLLYQNSPDNLRFIMIDPKRLDLPLFNDIPHLLTPVITHVPKIVNSLKWAILEMDRRLGTLEKHKKTDIADFNHDNKEKMPYLVIIIDELADLMQTAASEIETCVSRLAAKGRAAGIHLILATQHPSVNVITGTIKANITSRIAFAVGSNMNSRVILDTGGAEKLLGDGDMLFSSPKISKPKRLQGAFVDKDEIRRVVDFLREKDVPDYLSEVTETQSNSPQASFGPSSENKDVLLPNAKEVIIQAKKASASLLQRRLKVGYARAARLLDILEADGFIGPADGAKPRALLAHSQEDQEILEKIGTENHEELDGFDEEEENDNNIERHDDTENEDENENEYEEEEEERE